VSLEVSLFLSRDTAGTLNEARRLWQAVERDNLMIKIPATREGIPAIHQLVSEGINVNVTLLFAEEAASLSAGSIVPWMRSSRRDCNQRRRIRNSNQFQMSKNNNILTYRRVEQKPCIPPSWPGFELSYAMGPRHTGLPWTTRLARVAA